MSWDWTKEEFIQELRERRAEWKPDVPLTDDWVWSVVERANQERDAMADELKHLQKHVLPGMTDVAIGQALERESITKFLRGHAENKVADEIAKRINGVRVAADALRSSANAIERGDHLEKEK